MNLIFQAEHGNVKSILKVAKHYTMQEDYKKAHEYLLLAAEKGSVSARHKVGINYCFGINGIEQNLPLGVKYLQSAADQNNADAEFALAMICNNENVEVHLRENSPKNPYLFYLEKAAKHGHAYSQVLMGDLCIEGKMIPYNLMQGIFWYGCAALHNEEREEESKQEAIDKLKLLQDVVSKEIIDEIMDMIKSDYPSYVYLNYID